MCICILLSSFVIQKDTPPTLHIVFPKTPQSVTVDDFGNIYAIHNEEITKYNTNGQLQKTFSTKRYGKIEFVDVTNPLKILVYFKDFQQILFLDNQLSASSAMISLEQVGYEQSSLVCTSTNNSFWLYNKQNNELVRFDSESKLLVKTGNLKRILDIEINPNFIKEHNNYLYLNCPNEGILLFDIYGTYYKTIPLKQLKRFNIVNGNIFYFENRSLKEYSTETFNTIEQKFGDTLIKNVYWQNKRFYKVYSDSLVVEELN